jgi:hypothetical protein
MLDRTIPATPDGVADGRWHADVRPGDIVSFAFPVADADGERVAAPRPCVVINTKGPYGPCMVELVPSTAAGPKTNGDVRVMLWQEHRAAEVQPATPFDCALRIWISAQHAGFELGADGTPIIGRLTDMSLKRLIRMRRQIQTCRDVIAQRHRARQADPVLPHAAQFGQRSRS